jgi:Tol biopolymer transport system component
MTRLTESNGVDVEWAWSPDGLRIAYINSPGFFGRSGGSGRVR